MIFMYRLHVIRKFWSASISPYAITKSKEFLMARKLLSVLVALAFLLFVAIPAFAQETTGGLRGVVKDPSDAVVPHAIVVVSSDSLVGTKDVESDGTGNYRFANLPPGTYTITVTAKGFRTVKREVVIEVGHLPSVDITLEVGSTSDVVEVGAEAPLIDVTTTRTLTNVTSDIIENVPHGISYQ